jgi:hypothetical protein
MAMPVRTPARKRRRMGSVDKTREVPDQLSTHYSDKL